MCSNEDPTQPKIKYNKINLKKNKWKQPECSTTDEWIKKIWYIYTMEYYLAINKNENLSFAATWVDLEGIVLSEISQRKTNPI